MASMTPSWKRLGSRTATALKCHPMVTSQGTQCFLMVWSAMTLAEGHEYNGVVHGGEYNISIRLNYRPAMIK